MARPSSAVEESGPAFSLRVLDGPSEGRVVPLAKAETLVGRVGVGVAAVRLEGGRARLVPLEGTQAIGCNGVAVPPEGVLLQAGDRLDIAGATLIVDAS